jgi:hypothetical protein
VAAADLAAFNALLRARGLDLISVAPPPVP